MLTNFIQQLVAATYIFKDGYSLNPYKLSFRCRELEEEYKKSKYSTSHKIIQLSIVFGFVAIFLFGILDTILLPEEYKVIWGIRYGFMIPISIVMMTLLFQKNFEDRAEWISYAVLFCCPAGILGMIAVAPAPVSEYYYAGLLIMIFYPHLLRTNFISSVVSNLWILAAYNIVAIWINPLNTSVVINNNFFLVVYCFMGAITNYIQDLYVRIEFVSSKLLQQSKNAVEELFLEAHASNKAKSQFLAVVSHELRTPLNAIIGFSEILQHQMFGPIQNEKYIEYSRDIHDSGKHLLQLITDIMEVSRVDAGKSSLDDIMFDVVTEIDACMKMVQNFAAENGVRLAFNVPTNSYQLLADTRMFRQCLNNLLTNSIKFTPKEGLVEVDVKETEDQAIIIEVSDNGKGIAEDQLEAVLEPFTQAQHAYNREHEGLGLGLPLVNKLMKLHSGGITLKSELYVGTTVTMRFPPGRNGVVIEAGLAEELEQSLSTADTLAEEITQRHGLHNPTAPISIPTNINEAI